MRPGHRAYVRGVRIVSGLEPGPFAVSAGYDGTLRTWRLPDLLPGAAVLAHVGGAGGVDVTPDGWAVTGGFGARVSFWRVAIDRIEPALTVDLPVKEGDRLIETVAWVPHGRSAIVGVVGGSLWEVGRDGGHRFLDEEGLVSVNAVVCTADGRYLFVASDECTVRRYRREGRRWTLDARSARLDDHVDALALGPAGQLQPLLATTHGRSLWRADDALGALTFRSAPVAHDAINAVAWVGQQAWCGGDDRTIHEIHPDTLAGRPIVDTGRDIDSIAVTHTQILVATTAGLVAVDRASGEVRARAASVGGVAALCIDGEEVVVGLHDAPELWRLRGGRRVGVAEVAARVSCGSAEGLLFGLANGDVVRLEPGGPRVLATAAAEVEGVEAVPERELILAVDRSGTLTHIGSEVRSSTVTGPGRRLKSVRRARTAFGDWAVCVGKDHQLHVVDLDDPGAGARVLRGSDVASRTFNDVFYQDGIFYVACWDSRIHRLRLVAPDAVKALDPLAGHMHAVERLAWAAGTLLSVSYDGCLRGWPNGAADDAWSCSLSDMAVRRLVTTIEGRVFAAGYGGEVAQVDVPRRRVVGRWLVH